jgi:hypothetical protein
MVESTIFQFLEAFSNLMTKHSMGQHDWVARTGSYSIYALVSQITPEVHVMLRRWFFK